MKRIASLLAAIALLGAVSPARAQLPPTDKLVINQTGIQGGSNGQCLFISSTKLGSQTCGGPGTVTSVSVTTANGISGTVATATTTPAISLALGAITPTTVNGNTFTAGTYTLTGTAGKTLNFTNTITLSGTDGTTMTFPTTSATLARTDAANTFTGTQTVGALVATTVNGNTITTGTGTLTLGSVTLNAGAGGTLGSNAFTSTAYAPIASPTFTGTVTITTLAGNTSVTSPLYYGGSGAGSTATINGTSNGSPASAFLVLQSNGQFTGIGNTAPKAALDLNANTSSSPALVISTSLQRLQAADTAAAGMEMLSYGSSSQNILVGALAGGTSASPTAAPANRNMLSLRGYGYNGSSFQLGGVISVTTANLWSGSDQSTQINFFTTPVASTSITQSMTLNNSGGLSIGTSTDPGIGSLQINANIFAPNMPTTTGALGAAICYTTTTGQFQRDTNAGGCLVSSERYKHAIEPLQSALDEVIALKPVSFTYNDDVGIKGRQVGFVAEQTAAVDERLVGFDPDGSPQSVRYMQMSAILVGAIQQLKSDNDDLRACTKSWKCRLFGMK